MIRKPSNHLFLDLTTKLSARERRTAWHSPPACGRVRAGGDGEDPFQLDWIPFGRHAPYYAALETDSTRKKART
jgi:hypothetical protein